MKIAPTPVKRADRSRTASLVRYPTAFGILGVTSASHLLNDMIQSLMIAGYPIFKLGLHLSYWQIGFVTLAYQVTASLLQPLFGIPTVYRFCAWLPLLGIVAVFLPKQATAVQSAQDRK